MGTCWKSRGRDLLYCTRSVIRISFNVPVSTSIHIGTIKIIGATSVAFSTSVTHFNLGGVRILANRNILACRQ